MLDALYVLATIAFFAIMILYVRGCQRLGEQPGTGEAESDR